MEKLKEILSSLSGGLETRHARWKGIGLVMLTAAGAAAMVAIVCDIAHPPKILLVLTVAAIISRIK